ncbi:MAG: DEAD/DEAH box helicase [Polyangiaceae bacterium]|nr:DEAD/DEAH box helicase [Polyangiaceae bacterium]
MSRPAPPSAARSRSLEQFHPAVRAWFSRALGEPSAPQRAGWPLIASREHTLIAAPTGSGKTLAAFLSALNELIELGLESQLEERCYVLYVSPLKALSNDVEKNLQVPLEGIREELKAQGLPDVALRVSVRTGDTASSERARMLKKPPHVLVTTPESLYILLTSRGGRELLKGVRTLIVDEIHALVRDKRGSHLALSIERLEALAPGFVRVGLSATQKPIERVADFLGGEESRGRPRAVHIVDTGHKRHLDLAIEVPPSPLEAVMAGEVWEEIYDRVAELIREHKTTLVFVNTRRVAERVTRHLATRLGEEKVTSHHGSLSREQRFRAEQRLKSGELAALVATASLELGIDVGAVELVCQLGSTRSIATLLQRVGRAGHSLGGVPKGRVFPLSRDELVEQVALLHAFERGELDQVQIPEAPLDILAQQLVAAVAAEEEWQSDALFDLVRRAHPYRELSREVFDGILEMLADGFTTRRGRRGAHLHYDRVGELLKPRRGARLTAMTNGGAIPDTFDYEVVADPGGYFVGTINEDFAIESMAGDIFQLGNASWRIIKVEPGRVRVEDARGLPPSIPFWLGEAPARTDELSVAVSRLRSEVDEALSAVPAPPTSAELDALAEHYTSAGVPKAAASQFIEYLAAAQQALGCLPTQDTLVLERFFDESGGMQLVLHAPFGGRVNRAWGLSLRKRFCQRFNFELQAAATEDALILSLGPTHSFPLEEVFRYLHPNTVRPLLIQALLVAPMFETRWRWNATRSLAISRFRGGTRVPPRLQRMNAADLLTLVFPDQVACQENLEGPREVPEHPLVQQTVNDCLVEAMDVTAFESVLAAVVGGEKRLVARDLTEPSPLSLEILSARPYAFLDDAPLEERRTQAVSARRWLSPSQASELGALDPEAIVRVQEEAWPTVRDQDELADALQVLGVISTERANALGWRAGLEQLAQGGRVTLLTTKAGRGVWVAIERLVELRQVYTGASEAPTVTIPAKLVPQLLLGPEEVLVELVRGQVECRGPIRAAQLADELALPADSVELALVTLETEGFVLRGSFSARVGSRSSASAEATEWCERGLLARIHRYTLARLRSEIEPVQQTDFMRFLLRWQRVEPGHQGSGPDALAQVLDQLEGFEAPAAAWEQEILPARIADYDPAWLDLLCLSGRVTWLRRTPPQSTSSRRGKPAPVRATPIALVSRTNLSVWCVRGEPGGDELPELSPAAARVRQVLSAAGACFFMDLMGRSGLLRTQVEEGLAELVALGLANSDSFAGLRALIVPTAQRGQLHRRHGRRAGQGMELGGRWSLFDAPDADNAAADTDAAWNQTEQVARRLLVRWGVVFRKLAEREAGLPPWRDLVRVLRRLEARGEIRGGRFVAGFSGEQYALPEAVSQLRALRREVSEPTLVSISAADPLNLRGLTVAGERVPALLTNRLCFRAGEIVGTKQGRAIQVLEEEQSWIIRQTLVRTGALASKSADARLGWRGNRSQSTH